MIMEAASYLLRDAMTAALFLVTVWIVYRLLLARSGRLSLNRAVLLATLMAAPLILPVSSLIHSGIGERWPDAVDGPVIVIGATSVPKWLITVVMIYAAGVAVALLLQLAGHIRALLVLAGTRRKLTPWGQVMVSKRRKLIPFCWMGYVVVGSENADSENSMILIHEHIHAAKRHWADLLIAETVAALNWFNPAAWLMLEELKRVHEFQADRGVIRSGVDGYDYQMLLIRRGFQSAYRYAYHSFTGSALRSRIEMMIKPQRGRRYGLRVACVAAAALLGAVSATGSATLRRAMEDIKCVVQVAGDRVVSQQPASDGKPILIVDGKVVDGDVLNEIDPKTIDHITVDKTASQSGTITIALKH